MSDDVAIPLMALLMPLLMVVGVLTLRQSSRRREWRHQERMKALELGRPMPEAEGHAARTAIAIGAVMPVGVFAFAWLASMTTGVEGAWLAAAIVAGMGVIGGTQLARSSAVQRRPEDEVVPIRDADRPSNGKPPFDPDAYEAIVRNR
jgi:hypothetical protein